MWAQSVLHSRTICSFIDFNDFPQTKGDNWPSKMTKDENGDLYFISPFSFYPILLHSHKCAWIQKLCFILKCITPTPWSALFLNFCADINQTAEVVVCSIMWIERETQIPNLRLILMYTICPRHEHTISCNGFSEQTMKQNSEKCEMM